MKIKVPTPDEYKRTRRRKILNIIGGFFAGILLSILLSRKILPHGLNAVETYTWIALSIPPVISTLLAWLYGDDFWSLFKKKANY